MRGTCKGLVGLQCSGGHAWHVRGALQFPDSTILFVVITPSFESPESVSTSANTLGSYE
jgi:hypothetical protein